MDPSSFVLRPSAGGRSPAGPSGPSPSGSLRDLVSCSPTLSMPRPIPSNSFKEQKLFGSAASLASLQSLASSDPADAREVEFDEKEVWGVEEIPDNDSIAVTIPRVISRVGSLMLEGRSPFKEDLGKGLLGVSSLSPVDLGLQGPSAVTAGTSRRADATASLMIPQGKHQDGDPGDAEHHQPRKEVAQSAPVMIPAWPKHGHKGGSIHANGNDEDEDERLPPHEFLARENARNQGWSFSVCEGAGRTLKGKDLCRVRNAVLARTGEID